MSTHIHSVCAAMLQHVNTLAGSGQSSQSEWGQLSLRICSILMNRSAASNPSCNRTSSPPPPKSDKAERSRPALLTFT